MSGRMSSESFTELFRNQMLIHDRTVIRETGVGDLLQECRRARESEAGLLEAAKEALETFPLDVSEGSARVMLYAAVQRAEGNA